MQVQQAGLTGPGAWSIPDSKYINHSLTKPGQLNHPASQAQLVFSLKAEAPKTFTIQASQIACVQMSRLSIVNKRSC